MPNLRQKTLRKSRRNKRSWKEFKLFKKIKRVLKLFVISIFALTVSGILLAGFLFYKYIKSPLASSYSINTETTITETQPFSLAFIVLDSKNSEAPKISRLYYLIYEPLDKKYTIYKLPVTAVISLPVGIKDSELSRIYSLGNLVDKNLGLKYTTMLLEKFFAKRVDRFIITDEIGIEDFKETYDLKDYSEISKIVDLKNLTKFPETLALLKNNFESNIHSDEIMYSLSLLGEFNTEKVTFRELSEDNLSDDTYLDKKTEEIFVDNTIISEGKRVVILNGAGVERLGYQVSRFITNFGGSVVTTANAPKIHEKSFIVSDELDSVTLKRISYELNIKDVVGSEELDSIGLSEAKGVAADITVVVGIDYSTGL